MTRPTKCNEEEVLLKKEAISIVGYSLRAPNTSSVPEFAKALRSGKDLTTSNTRYPHGHLGLPPRQGRIKDSDFECFDAKFFGLSHKQAEAMDPLIRMLLEVSYEALLDSQLSMDGIRGSNTGVYVGHCFSDDASHKTTSFNPDKNGYELVNGTNSMAANRLSYFYDFKGPSLVIDTACSSSLVALHYAVRDVKDGIVDRAVVAGLSFTPNPHKNASFAAFKMLSPTGHCHVFDERADGYCRSDGVACIVIERSNEGYATIIGTGVNSDGCKAEGITYPNANVQARLMKEVFERSSHQIKPEDIVYHEAHGTGTIVGDQVELAALSKVYNHPMVLGSVKSNIGHSEGASGLMGVIKILLMIEDKFLYPNYGFEKSPHASINDGPFKVLKSMEDWIPGACSISSFGFGGTNAFTVLAPSLSLKNIVSLSKHQISSPFASSAHAPKPTSSSAYYATQRALGNHNAFPFIWDGSIWQESSPLAFVFNGQGSQWEHMGAELIETNKSFHSTMERLQEGTSIPLIDLYRDGSKWLSKEFSIIGIVSFQLGMLSILRDQGIRKPDFFFGHSIGELVCPFLAGLVLTEVEVLQNAMIRTNLVRLIDSSMRLDLFEAEPSDGFDFIMKLESSSESESYDQKFYVKRKLKDSSKDAYAIESFSMDGQMVVVGCSAAELDTIIATVGLRETRVACYNGPRSQTVSGATVEVDSLIDYVQRKKKDVFVRKIDTDSVAYHAIYLKVFREYLRTEFGKVRNVASVVSVELPSEWISTSRNKFFNVDYLVDNILRPVYFQEAVEQLPKGCTILEIGPSSILLSQIKRIRSDLKLITLVEKKEPTSIIAPLEKLRSKWSIDTYKDDFNVCDRNDLVPYQHRYPQLWGRDNKFRIMAWDEFELPDKNSDGAVISYDLTKKPWSSLRDHLIRGQNLFPAAGFIHALWSGISFKPNVEMLNFKIHSPLVISSSVKAVKIRLHKAGPHHEIWDDMSQVRYASATVQIAQPTPVLYTAPPSLDAGKESLLINGSDYYPNLRRLGYEYGKNYQLVKRLGCTEAYLKEDAGSDWVSYIDAMLHLRLFNEDCFSYPIGFDRVYIRFSSLSDASSWVLRPQENTVVNDVVLLEGLRMEYLPIQNECYTVHSEVFVEYNESNEEIDVEVLASLICRESTTFAISAPLTSKELTGLAKLLCESAVITQDQSSATVVLSDSSDISKASLLLTVDTKEPTIPCCLVARWGNVKAYRCSSSELSKLDIVSNWQDAVRMTKSFIWKGRGSSGAVASLAAETKDQIRAISYQSTDDNFDIIGVEKGMRHNYITENGSHGIFVDQAVDNQTDDNFSSTSAYLRVGHPGHLSSLVWEKLDPSLHPVKVCIATLNFRDIMRALGQLKERDLSVGLEFSGYNRLTKQRVFGVAKNSLASHCSPVYSFETPSNFSDIEAATIPVVYLTAYYALFHKANLREGQSVLIHAGTGGVGMAAIRLAQSRGLSVFTTCSSAKRQYLKEMFGLEDHQIGDSRSEAFVQTIFQGTKQRGVDAALNQLSGALQVATLRCVAPGGHFCEIGKYDILQNTTLAQGLLGANISFHAIDLLPLLHDSSNKPLWDQWLCEGFAHGEIVPLPVKEFHYNDVESAFRFMSQAKHMGKIVITGLDSGNFLVCSKGKRISGQTHLITGGLGGLGLSIACRLASGGCKRVYLVGRRGVSTGYQKNQIAIMEKMGCEVVVVKADILSLKKDSLLEIDVIWHGATVYRDAILSDMTKSIWNSVYDTKVKGYHHLRETWPMCRIVTFSSVAAYFGNAMQTSYALANATLDDLARKNSSKLLSIRLGPLDNVGFIVKGSNNRLLFERVPFQVMNIDSVLDSIMQIAIHNESGVFGLYECKKIFTSNESAISSDYQHASNGNIQSSYSLEDAQSFMSVILGGSPEQYSASTSLQNAGLDSLSTMEVVNYIHKESGKSEFKPSDIDDSFTVRSLVDYIIDVRGSSSSTNKNSELSHALMRQVVGGTTVGEDGIISKHSSSTRKAPNEIKTAFESFEKEENCTPVISLKIHPSSIDFGTLLSALESSDVLVLRQSDPVIFNHGAPLESNDEMSIAKFMDNYVALAQAFESTNTVVIVVVEGQVRGGGMLFPAVADLCLATEEATFGLPEIHRNMVPSVVSKALVERLGRSTARRLSLTGENFHASRALQMGLIDHILKSEELDTYISGVVRRWESRVPASKFIKEQLLPRLPSNSAAMGTVAGTWLMQGERKDEIGEHEVLHVSIHDNIAVLTMCDTTYQNTMSFEMTAAIRAAIPRLKKEAKVIILASSLNHFHVGLNPAKVREWSSRPTVHVAADMKECYMGYVELATLGLPLIAVLNGKVYGGGLPIALWCDYRIATSDVDMHFGNSSRGMSPAGQLSELLKDFLSPSEIMESYLENSHWNSEDLLKRKIVSSVTATKEQALSQARKLAFFIAKNPSQGIRDTLHLVKLKYSAEVADEESWLIAKKITAGTNELFRQPNHTFDFDPCVRRNTDVIETSSSTTRGNTMLSSSTTGYGIIAIEAYTPPYAIDADTLERHSIRARKKNGQRAVAVWDNQEDSISMAMNAVSKLIERHIPDPYSIGRLEVGTESNVDMAKSIKSYLMDLFPADHVNVEGVDNINACYGGTAALLNTLSWSRETGGYGIVVATDTAEMDLSDSAWRGASAVAMLVGPNPWVEIHPERISCFKNTDDFLKPRFSTQATPVMKTKDSMNYYIDALDTCVKTMMDNHSIDTSRFDAFVFHGGLCATFMKIVERHLMQIHGSPENWNHCFDDTRRFATKMGGLYTASLYINLLSLLYSNSESRNGGRILDEIGLFAYGSGSTATLMRASIHHSRSHDIDLEAMIDKRKFISFDTLRTIVDSQKSKENVKILAKHQGVYYRGVSSKDSNRREYNIQSNGEVLLLPENDSAQHSGMNFGGIIDALKCQIQSTKITKRVQATLALLIAWSWWLIAAIFLNHEKTDTLFIYASVTFVITLVLNTSSKTWLGSQRGNGWSFMFGHYLFGSFVYIAYIILLIVSSSFLMHAWRSIYFGWYTYDSLFLIIYWNDLSQSISTFLTIHHSLSLLCTGAWLAVGGNWNDLILIAVTIWLTSDIWHYTLSTFRLLSDLEVCRRLNVREALMGEQCAFYLERAQRIVAYLFIFLVEERSTLVWLTFGTGLLFDVIDSYFRILSIRSRKRDLGELQSLQQQKAQPQHSHSHLQFDEEEQNENVRLFPIANIQGTHHGIANMGQDFT